MSSFTVWKLAEGPNYQTNIDKLFPYSDLPYQKEYTLVKIPASRNNLVEHVDYWGEGRIVSGEGIRGFTNSYNVNHQYQLVSSGADRDRKIPNRIPVVSYIDCDTSAYIKDNSVITVTVSGPHLNRSCAKDIARIVNTDQGRVIVFGISSGSQEILDLAIALQEKSFMSCTISLQDELQDLTYFQGHVAFINVSTVKDNLHENIVNGNYEKAVMLSKSLGSGDQVISEVIDKLISSTPRNVMSYAYKLWCGEAKDIVRKVFPVTFQNIFNQHIVRISNKRYMQALKLAVATDSYFDRLAWGDRDSDETNEKLNWKFIPVWKDNEVTFKLHNVYYNYYLKLDANVDSATGDRKVWGSSASHEDRHRYYLEPILTYDTVAFRVINFKYLQPLKMALGTDNVGDRKLWGHHGDVPKDDRFLWKIAA